MLTILEEKKNTQVKQLDKNLWTTQKKNAKKRKRRIVTLTTTDLFFFFFQEDALKEGYTDKTTPSSNGLPYIFLRN